MWLNKKNWQKTEYVLFVGLTVALAMVTLYLSYKQASYAWQGITDTGYHSDVLAYMKTVVGIDSGYKFPYPIMFWLTALLHVFLPIEWAMAAAITIFQTSSFILLRYFVRRYLKKKVPDVHGIWQVFTTFMAFAAFFYSMIFVYNHPFPGLRFYYMGVFSPNPFHNATYIAARPFSIVCVFLFVELLETYEQKVDLKKALFFSLMLLLATMTKPSFTIVFCGAAGLIMLWRFLKNKCAAWKQTFLLGCMFLPTFADLVYQFGGVFTGLDSKGQETGIGFALLKVWREYCSNYLVAVVLMIFFPMVVAVFQYRKIFTNTLYRFGWQIYGISLAMFIVLYEKGFRAVDANFSWGYMIGAFFLVVSSLAVLLEDTVTAKSSSLKLLIQWAAFGIHLCCGLFYFLIIFTGSSYY